jgi:hypothetical protein
LRYFAGEYFALDNFRAHREIIVSEGRRAKSRVSYASARENGFFPAG